MSPEQAEQLPTKVIEAHLAWLLGNKPHMHPGVRAEYQCLLPVWRKRRDHYEGKTPMRAKRWGAA